MYELQPAKFLSIAQLFGDMVGQHGSVNAVLTNPSLGQVLVDDPASPRYAILRGPEGLYLAGAPQPNDDLGRLKAAIADWDYVYPSAAWLPIIDRALPHRFMIAHDRIRLALTAKPDAVPTAPRGFAMRADPGQMGFSITHREAVVSTCSADMVVGDYAEIGVWTAPAYRGQGLAKVAARACIVQAFEQGVRTIGWHCHGSNMRSLKLALSLGFTITHRYFGYSASLPAENLGDLEPSRCQDLAEHFEAGASQLTWLDFHAAVGWVLAGKSDNAISAIERLVARGWQGQAEWLEQHWGLQNLASNPRFQAAVQRQRRLVIAEQNSA